MSDASKSFAPSLSRDEVRDYDRIAIERGIPGPVLMENAAGGASRLLLNLGAHGPVAIVCGKGNNAGDGFVMARLLHGHGLRVAVEMVGEPSELAGDAATAFAPLKSLGIPIFRMNGQTLSRLRQCQWIVDALLGTGTRGEIRSPFREAIEWIHEANRSVFAVDLPSGLDGDLGVPLGPTIQARHTATFVARKKGFDNPASQPYTGLVHVIPIGA
ncbi:MAG: NAD(P)H-hydrate epimerase [Planctomycetota bacterium]